MNDRDLVLHSVKDLAYWRGRKRPVLEFDYHENRFLASNRGAEGLSFAENLWPFLSDRLSDNQKAWAAANDIVLSLKLGNSVSGRTKWFIGSSYGWVSFDGVIEFVDHERGMYLIRSPQLDLREVVGVHHKGEGLLPIRIPAEDVWWVGGKPRRLCRRKMVAR